MKESKSELVFQIINGIFIIFLSIAMIYPFIHMLSISLSTPAEALRRGIHIIPLEFSLDSYKAVFSNDTLWTGLYNTLFRTIIGTTLSLIFMTAAAYSLSKKYLPHRYFLTLMIVITMYFQGGLIPTYLLVKNIGLIDSRWALIIPCLFNTFSFLIMRNYFMAIPEDIEESAKIDGANDIVILLRIIVPISMPIIATITLWTAVQHWNQWFDALIYIQDPQKIVLQTYLRRLVVENQDMELRAIMEMSTNKQQIPETIKAAVLMVTTIPILLVYPYLQKYFVKGIMLGSLKG